jgi:LuxR family maltose regulon positive regulatory protein
MVAANPLLETKIYIPKWRPGLVSRQRLIERLDQGIDRRLILVSAPAGFGKTTLLAEWIAATPGNQRTAGWVSLDQSDNDPTLFWSYLITALQKVRSAVGRSMLTVLSSPQPPPIEAMVTSLINEITAIEEDFTLILDDFHAIDAPPIHRAVAFLLDHLPPRMHLVIASRADPPLPLARLRGRGELIELRAADLRFTPDEAAAFCREVMRLDLSAADVAALAARTEGWIAGLQLAALSLQGRDDVPRFIRAFSGDDRYIGDYLVEEVLQRQPDHVRSFLLQTAILDRLCGPLCDAVLLDPAVSGQEVLEYLERANLFTVPLDNERHWYRYHRLFADLLRQRLLQSAASSPEDRKKAVAGLHLRASEWYEGNGLEIEAFHHAASAHDVERAERLIEGNGMPLHFRGAVAPVLNWLESLPRSVLDANPLLWTAYASVLLVTGQAARAEKALHDVERTIQNIKPNDNINDIIGRIAAIRATLAAGQNRVQSIITQSHRALEYLHPNNQAFRTSTAWKLGYAYHLQGNRAAAGRAYTEVIQAGKATGNVVFTLLATIGLGNVQEASNHLPLAAQTYRGALETLGDHPLPFASEAHLGLARILYEWDDLDAAQRHAQQGAHLAGQLESDGRVVACQVLLAGVQRARGDLVGASGTLAGAAEFARRHTFVDRMREVAAAQVLTSLRQGNLAAAADLAQTHDLPISQARVYLARGEASTALAILDPFRQRMEAKGWQDERLKVMVLQAVAYHACRDEDEALRVLDEALALAEPSGFIRIFVDEGEAMRDLLRHAAARGLIGSYTRRLLSAFDNLAQPASPSLQAATGLAEPVTARELEVLRLIAAGMRNQEIADHLFISLPTVKRHIANVYGKLAVTHRTEAVARAHELNLL